MDGVVESRFVLLAVLEYAVIRFSDISTEGIEKVELFNA